MENKKRVARDLIRNKVIPAIALLGELGPHSLFQARFLGRLEHGVPLAAGSSAQSQDPGSKSEAQKEFFEAPIFPKTAMGISG